MKTKIFFVIATLATLVSCSGNKSKEQKGESLHEHEETKDVVKLNESQRKALSLKLGTFEMRNLTTLVKTNGRLEVPPAASADITAVIGGNVKEIKVFHGDKVNKGQVLAVLEHPDYIVLQENFAETASKLDFLEQEFNRQKELFDNNVSAGKDFQQVKSEFNTMKAKYEGLKARLRILNLSPENVLSGNISSTISIVSPISGYVNDVNIKLGTYVDARNKLFKVTDNREIHADFMVYENDVHLLKEGQKVDFTVANRPGEELTAIIFAIGKEFEPNTRAVHIHAKLDKSQENLVPGMYVSGHIHTDENYVRTLPNDAVVTEGTKSYIFVLDDTGTGEEHEETDHGTTANHEEHNADVAHSHEHEAGEHTMAFRMAEVITGSQEGNYTEIKLLSSLPENSRIVMNAAYYLLADLGKEETEHEH